MPVLHISGATAGMEINDSYGVGFGQLRSLIYEETSLTSESPGMLWHRLEQLSMLPLVRAFSALNSGSVLAHPVCTDRNAALDPSSTPVAKAGPISDKLPLTDK
jgi:hypothetical protein